jgi:N4-gp56 family major capsid protein
MADTNTTRGILTESYKANFYESQLLYTAERQLVHQQLGQRNRTVPAGENAYSVVWTRYDNLSDRSDPEAEGTATTAEGMSATQVTGTVAQYAGAVKLTDVLLRGSKDDLKKVAYQRLGYQAGLAIDKVVRDVAAIGGTRRMATLSESDSDLGFYSTIPQTGVLSVSELRKATRTLMRNNALPVGSKLIAGGREGQAINPEGLWVAVISPDSVYDLQGDTTTGAWIDANKYGDADKLFTGEVGKLYGVRFLQSRNAYVMNEDSTYQSAIVASGEIHVSLITGADYFGVTKFQNLETFWKPLGSAGTEDPTNKLASAAWKTTFGARVLNSNYAVSLYHSIGRNKE